MDIKNSLEMRQKMRDALLKGIDKWPITKAQLAKDIGISYNVIVKFTLYEDYHIGRYTAQKIINYLKTKGINEL